MLPAWPAGCCRCGRTRGCKGVTGGGKSSEKAHCWENTPGAGVGVHRGLRLHRGNTWGILCGARGCPKNPGVEHRSWSRQEMTGEKE